MKSIPQRVNQFGVIEKHDLPFQELSLHGVNMTAIRQAAGDDNPVETAKHANYPVLVPFNQRGVAHAA
jgi:hypothetical protein